MVAEARDRVSFEEVLLRTASAAARAPSSHNSQPWAIAHLASATARDAVMQSMGISSSGGELVAIAIDRERELTGLPDLRVEMIASCGMFLHSLVEVLRAEGWKASVVGCGDATSPLPVPGWPSSLRGVAVVRVTPAPSGSSKTVELLKRRATNRGPYDRAPLDRQAFARIAAADGAFHAGVGEVRVELVEDRALITRAARYVRRHAKRDFVDPRAWGETYSYIRFRDGDPRAKEDGFDIGQLFGPLGRRQRAFLELALSPRVMQLFRRTPYANVMARGLGDRVLDSGALLCVTTRSAQPEPPAILDAGATIMDAWLRATDEGLSVHPVSVVLQHPDLRAGIERELGVSGRMVFFARVGRATRDMVSAVGMTARRTPSLIRV